MNQPDKTIRKRVLMLTVAIHKVILSIHNHNVSLLMQASVLEYHTNEIWIDVQDFDEENLTKMLEDAANPENHDSDGFNRLYNDESELQALTLRVIGALNCNDRLANKHLKGNMDKHGPVVTSVKWSKVDLKWKDIELDPYIE